MEQRAAQPKINLSVCPRCGAELEMVEGWTEYGDQTVEIQRLGCMKCGYTLYEDEDYRDDEED